MTYDAVERSRYSGQPVECYRFVMGSSEWRLTSADVDVTLATGLYSREVISRDQLDFTGEQRSSAIEVKVPRANPVAALFIAYTPASPVALTIYRKHRSDAEVVTIFIGKVVSAQFDGPDATLRCAPISQVLDAMTPGLLHAPTCQWALYGSGCTVPAASFKDSGTVLTVVGANITAAVFGTHADGWYTNGWVQLASGDRRFVVDHVGTQVTLASPFIGLAPGAAVDGYAGCARTEAVCASKFSNLVNFMGFSRVPTRNPYTQAMV